MTSYTTEIYTLSLHDALPILTGVGRSSPPGAVNIASPEFKADPFPFYARLRADAPVYRTTLPTREPAWLVTRDRKSTRLNSSHTVISYAVFCLKKKK